MNKIISLTTFFTLLFSCNSGAQITIANDSSFMTWDTAAIREIDNKYHLKQDAEIEVRFWILHLKTRYPKLFILYKNSHVFNARFFSRDDQDSIFIESNVDSKKLNNLWKCLLKNHVLTICNSDSLRDKNGKRLHETGDIAYVVDLITKKNKRSYMYLCAKANTILYPYLNEYKWVLNIVNSIYQTCKLSPETNCN